ncbi:hypothetical protein SUGI_0581850 [Cryptomeria japonica]|nr:hypothetical protein SUGI_0581850 [Cryptomeria japonica]
MDFRYLYPKGQHYFLAYADGQGGKPTRSYFDGQNRTTSTVTGKVIGRKEELDTIPDLLLQATSHSGPGAFDKISYVSRSKSKGGVAPTAELSSVPGQEVIGRHYFLGEPDYYGGQPTWETFMPYSRVTAKLESRVVVDPNSVPWLSLQATSHMGSIYMLASISYVQRVSTTGGKPPESIDGAQIGDIYMSPYTAVYWFYTPQ